MKFCLSHKKYLLAGIYIICVIFTCFNARFYHTPLAKICSVSEMETMSREGTRGAEEHYYTQKITARILNGAYKGKEITLSNEYTPSQVQTQKYHKGDTVLLNGSKDRPGKTIRSVKRDIYLVVLVGGLIILLIYITRKQGGYTIVSVILNTLIFAYGFQLLGDGKNILRICNVIALLFSLTTLICLNGIHRKTWAAVLSTLCVLFLIMIRGWRQAAGWLMFAGTLLLFVAVANPLMSHRGASMIVKEFHQWITWEAVGYGITSGLSLASLILWFACYSVVMTEDKFLYLFGQVAPGSALLITSGISFSGNWNGP